MINSEEYGWNDTNVVMLGRPIIGLLGIRYKESQEKTNIYGKGKSPRRRGRGRVTYEGEIKVLGSELWALMQSHGTNQSILSIAPFDIVNSFAPEPTGVVSTNILKYVEFTEVEISVNEGDNFKEITLPIIIGDIEWNV